MFLQKRTRWKSAYPNHYKRALALSIFPYLQSIVFASRRTYPLQRELYRLTTFLQDNRVGQVLPIYRKINPAGAGCSHLTCSHPVFLPFWPVCIINFHTFAHDGTSTTVHVFSPYHPSRFLPECCFPLGILFPAASHPTVTSDACAGRLFMMEHEVKSIC